MPAADFHFYEDTFNRLSAALGTYVSGTAANIIGAISGVAYTLLMIYMMLWGWTTLRGMISEPITDAITRIVRLTVIIALAINVGIYNGYIVNFLWNSPDALASVVASGYSNPLSNVQYLDTLMGKLYDLGDAYWQKGNATTIPSVGLLLVAILIWAAGVIATAYGAFLFALSKMALAVLLGIGPVFVLLLIFNGTKRFFESWLGQALNYVFLIVLTAATVKLMVTIIDFYLGASMAGTIADPTIDRAIPAIVLCIICALVMMQMPSLASALGGGAAISTLGAAAWAYGKTAGSFAAMRPTNLRREMNKLRSDGRIARGVFSNGVGGAAAGRVAGAAGPAARGAGYAAGRAVSAPMAVYRRITNARTNAVSKG